MGEPYKVDFAGAWFVLCALSFLRCVATTSRATRRRLSAPDTQVANSPPFAGSDSLLVNKDNSSYPDLQMYPTVAGAVTAVYSHPAVKATGKPMVLKMSTIAYIFGGDIKTWDDSRILADQEHPEVRHSCGKVGTAAVQPTASLLRFTPPEVAASSDTFHDNQHYKTRS